MTEAIITALALTTANLIFSLVVVFYSFNKKWKTFAKLVFGSMTIRFFFSAAAVWICIAYFNLDAIAFSLTFIIATFALLFVEILLIHNRTKSINLNKNQI